MGKRALITVQWQVRRFCSILIYCFILLYTFVRWALVMHHTPSCVLFKPFTDITAACYYQNKLLSMHPRIEDQFERRLVVCDNVNLLFNPGNRPHYTRISF